MNAKEARELTLSISSKKQEKQYNDIQKRIEESVGESKFSCFHYEYLLPGVEKKLKEEGFSISQNNGRMNEICIEISW